MSRWHSCNILHFAADAKRLWQFDAKGSGFALNREQRVPHTETLPGKLVAKNWASLWQPKLNVAWLPPENVFLRVIELPASNADETFSMVELQLEKLSPLPVTQIVWTMHILAPRSGAATKPAGAEAATTSLQTVIVVIAARNVVEEFLGKLESENFLADRLETPMLDRLEAVEPATDGAWLFPLALGEQNAALVAWWYGGAWRNLSFVTLPVAGDRAKDLKDQLAHLTWSGEIEGWLTVPPKWHLVADPATAVDWQEVLQAGLGEPVTLLAPPSVAELAARTARRAALPAKATLLPPEFTTRYHQQFIDRLWLRGLFYAGMAYVFALVIYFSGVGYLSYRTGDVERQVAQISNDFTNSMQLTAQYKILQERSQLKYAALDCWQLVAQELPPGITLQRSSFADGLRLSLSGQVPSADTQKVIDFYDALRKAKLNGQPMFNPNPSQGDQLVYHQQGGNMVAWNFGLELLHTEALSQ
jgi:hypothetical protein